jgi:signal transduction histidine kinase
MTTSKPFKITWLSRPSSNVRPAVAVLAVAVSLLLLIWSLSAYQPARNLYGSRAIYSLVLLSVCLALLGRFLLLRLLILETSEAQAFHRPQRLREEWRPLFLFDITAPVYLAAAVLINTPAAVLTALITQMFLQAYTFFRGYVSWREASYRVAATALVVLLSGATYSWISGSVHNSIVSNLPFYHFAESKEFLGSILAAVVMQLLLGLVSLPIIAETESFRLRTAWRAYLHSPVLRYQALILSVGPLIPIVDVFDDVSAELAWLFFLIPLFAIYYLALVNTRLGVRTDELQRTLQDLKSARQRQDELSDYASLITRVQEEERRRLARELHDDTAQALIALSLGLNGLERAIGKQDLPEKDIQWLSNLQNLADATLEGVRRACRDLRPSVLDDLGLRAALEWLGDSSATRGVPCSFTCAGSPQPTPPEAEIAIYRIVQEALSNIWRHAHATQASIELYYRFDLLQVTICDNGQGFAVRQQGAINWVPTPDHNSQSGLGLLGMRERATLIGANLSITATPGKGCTIILSLPLTKKDAQDVELGITTVVLPGQIAHSNSRQDSKGV